MAAADMIWREAVRILKPLAQFKKCLQLFGWYLNQLNAAIFLIYIH